MLRKLEKVRRFHPSPLTNDIRPKPILFVLYYSRCTMQYYSNVVVRSAIFRILKCTNIHKFQRKIDKQAAISRPTLFVKYRQIEKKLTSVSTSLPWSSGRTDADDGVDGLLASTTVLTRICLARNVV